MYTAGGRPVFLVLRGATVQVRKPDGSTVEHVMKRTLAIPSGEAMMIGYELHYKVGDHTIIVRADLAEYVNSQCPQCKRLL